MQIRRKACGARCAGRARRRLAAASGDGPIDRLRRAGRSLAEARDFPRAWQRPPFDRAAEIDRDRRRAAPVRGADRAIRSRRATTCLSTPTRRAVSAARSSSSNRSASAISTDGSRGSSISSRDRGFSRTRKGSGYKFSQDATRTDVLAARDCALCGSAAVQEETPTPTSRRCCSRSSPARPSATSS